MKRDTVVGVIGAGQLARMMYESASPLAVPMKLLAETPDSAAATVFAEVTVGDYTDLDTVKTFAAGCDVLTFDHEHVPTKILKELQELGAHVYPSPEALVYAQDKALMRAKMDEIGAPNPKWAVVGDPDELREFGDATGWPIIAKTSRGGYDGKGVWKLEGPSDAATPFQGIAEVSAGEPVQIVAEEFVNFDREMSALVVRTPSGQAVSYPISETIQREGICRETITPAPNLSSAQQSKIQAMALNIAQQLGVVGVLAVELMERGTADVVVNELAMRPHNTGHWTIDGAVTSQFENHLRAVLNLPLGDPTARDNHVVMVNVLGGQISDLTGALLHCFARDPKLKAHIYGKQVRPGRKVGHVTTFGDNLEAVLRRARHAANYLMGVDDDE